MLLGADILESSTFHGLYLEEPPQIVTVNTGERGEGRVTPVMYFQSLLSNTDLLSRGKDFKRTLS